MLDVLGLECQTQLNLEAYMPVKKIVPGQIRRIIQHQGIDAILKEKAMDTDVKAFIAQQCATAQLSPTPYILHMLGIPGSGKSTFVKTLNHTNTIVISFDSIMEALPQYQLDKERLGYTQAFINWETIAREIGYEILFRGIEGRCNIIFDHGGARADHLELLAYSKQHLGYAIRIVAMLVSTEVAILNAHLRERFVPLRYFYERAKTLNELLPGYKEIADNYQEYF